MNDNTNQQTKPTLLSVIKGEWYILVLILATLAIGLYLYPQLPAKVPTHWNFKGQVDGWSSKTFAVWFFPLLNLGLYFMMLLLPKIDPRRDNYARFAGAYKVFRLILSFFFALIYMAALLAGLGYPLRIDFFVRFSISLLFLVLGNYMGKIQPNYFVGIKTPWTLANEEVWRKTHRFAGPLWVGAGAAGVLLSFFQAAWSATLMITLFVLMGLVPVVYSYLLFKRITNKGAA